MKKVIRYVLSFAIAISVLSAGLMITASAENTVFDGGNGTEEFPYLISTAEQLNQLRNYSDVYFLQTDDIDMSSNYYYAPEKFGGGYDGGGHSITGLRTFLFKENAGVVRNLGLVKSNVSSPVFEKDGNFKMTTKAAALAIANSGTISGCYSVGGSVVADTDFSGSDATSMSYAGGLVERNDGIIENCYTRGDVRARSYARSNSVGGFNANVTAKAYAGGIAARSYGVIKNCYSVADVNASATKANGYTGSQIAYEGIIAGTTEYEADTINCYYKACENCSQGTSVTSIDGINEMTEVSDNEIKSYEIIRKLSPQFDYTWSMDHFDEHLNDGYPILYVQSDMLMDLQKSHKTGNHKEAFDLEIGTKFEGLYRVYYCVLGKDDGFKEYTSPIQITDKDTTVVAYLENTSNTDVRRTYKLDYHMADYPVSASVAPGLYHEPKRVELMSGEAGAEIYYTTDGSDPKNGTRYIGAISIVKNTTVSAVAKINGEFGDALNYEYKISPIITASEPAGDYTQPISVSLTKNIAPYEIYYTTNGLGDPRKENSGAIKYTGEFEIYQTTLLKVAACYDGEWSEVYEFQYDFPQVEITPTVPAGEYNDVQSVDFSCNLPYLDLEVIGGTSPVEIYKTTTVYVNAKYKNDVVKTHSFTYTLPEPEITATPSSGEYNSLINVELSCNIPSYDLYYTLDGSNPETNGVLYTEPIELDSTKTIKAVAKYGDITITENSFNYIIDLPYVTANYPSGSYRDALEVTLTSSDAFYDVYYTVDGSNPKTNGIKYSESIKITETCVLRAVPVFDGIFGTASSYEYNILSADNPTITADNFSVDKEAYGYYTVSFNVNSTLPNSKFADVYVGLYNGEGELLEAKKYIQEFAPKLNNPVILLYITNLQPQSDCYFKIMCWDKGTTTPLFKNGVVNCQF